jgi:hypothetical protein
MPPKRNQRGRPRGSKNKRKRYNRVRRRRKPLALKQHNFCERFEESIPLLTPTVNTSGNLAITSTKKFSFDMIAQHASYADLFDEYKIDKIVATFRWSPSAYVNVNTTASYSSNLSPLLFFKVDHNDDTADSLVELKKSMKTHYKMLKYDEPFTIQLRS